MTFLIIDLEGQSGHEISSHRHVMYGGGCFYLEFIVYESNVSQILIFLLIQNFTGKKKRNNIILGSHYKIRSL